MNVAVRAHRLTCGALRRVAALVDGPAKRGLVLAVLGLALAGCTPGPRVLMPDEQHVIGREMVEYPAAYELRRYATGFMAPTAIAFDADGSLLVAEGERGEEPRIWRIPANGGRPILFYPARKNLIPLRNTWQLYGPIGGMVVVDGNVIVTHRDENDLGVVTALDRKGGHKTLCAGLPTQGDYGLTDIAYEPRTNRLWFGCGTVTNSGVVGLDNFQIGWVRAHPDAHDVPLHDIELLGYKFQTPNPMAGIFGPAEIAVTAAFQAFSQSFAIRIKGSPDGKPDGAIYSVAVNGGFANVEAFGVHNPRGIAFNEFGAPYITNDGMEMRGTRPVKGDPDAFIRIPPGQPWLGWPDYSTTFDVISDPKYQPPEYLISKSGYPQVRPLIDIHASNLTPPVRETMLEAALPSLSGAAKVAFVPETGPFSKEMGGSAIIALGGDRSPWASGGIMLPHPVGFKLVRVDLDRHVTRDFIRNVGDLPGSKIDDRNRSLIERPVDVKFGPDGAMYILDEGKMEVRNGQERFQKGGGQIFRLVPVRVKAPTTQEKAE
jgi:glucose/arabinose dehydrogenase